LARVAQDRPPLPRLQNGGNRSSHVGRLGEASRLALNRAGTTFRKLSDADRQDITEKKAVALMLAQPSLIKRPVLDAGGALTVGFKPDEYRALL
jgi:arsenate reductase-like glutaredoxin family protein